MRELAGFEVPAREFVCDKHRKAFVEIRLMVEIKRGVNGFMNDDIDEFGERIFLDRKSVV